MIGSASGVNNTFDRVSDYYGLNFGEYDYFEAASIYDEHDYKHEGDFTLVYYIRKNEDNLDDLIKQIVQENNSIYKRYQLNEIDVVTSSSQYRSSMSSSQMSSTRRKCTASCAKIRSWSSNTGNPHSVCYLAGYKNSLRAI